MFILKLYDREGNELKEGDIVKISNGKGFEFYSEVKFLETEMAIAPFHTFSFHSFVKVDKVPFDAVLSEEKRYRIWLTTNTEKDLTAHDHEKYLIDWRQCEKLLEEKCFRINRIVTQKTLF